MIFPYLPYQDTQKRSKRNCTCAYQRVLLAPQLRGYRGHLGCYCEFDPVLERCQCSDEPWGDGKLSEFVGKDFILHPRELDDPANRNLYKVGCYLHCLVRRIANRLITADDLDMGIAEVESWVFRTPFKEPFRLDLNGIGGIANLFAIRTFSWHRTIRRPHIQDAINRRTHVVSDSHDFDGLSTLSMEPVIVMSGPGDFLHTAKNLQGYSWADIWRTVHMLELAGISERRSQSYDLVLDASWPELPRERSEMEELQRAETLESRVLAHQEQLQRPGLDQAQIKKLMRAVSDAEQEAWLIRQMLAYKKALKLYEARLDNDELSPEERLATLEKRNALVGTLWHAQQRRLRICLKNAVSSGNKHLKRNLKDWSSLDQANALAAACQRDGVADNLEHFFSSGADRTEFLNAYVWTPEHEMARKHFGRPGADHAGRLYLEIEGEDE